MVKFEDMKDLASSWLEEFAAAINASKAYARSAKKWGVDFDGAIVLTLQPCGEVEEEFSLFLDLQAGQCLGAQLLGPGEEPPRPPTVRISGPMATWKKVVFKEVDVTAALMNKMLELEGDMALVMRYAQASIDLVNSTEQTDRTLFTQYDLGDS
jgi:putative sterol carrier protein